MSTSGAHSGTAMFSSSVVNELRRNGLQSNKEVIRRWRSSISRNGFHRTNPFISMNLSYSRLVEIMSTLAGSALFRQTVRQVLKTVRPNSPKPAELV
jgi:hypothetical protein